MVEIKLSFPSIEAATEFMARGAQMITEPEKKKPGRPAKEKTQATVEIGRAHV